MIAIASVVARGAARTRTMRNPAETMASEATLTSGVRKFTWT